MSVNYRPGEIPVAVTRRGAVALSADTPPALAVRIWTEVAEGRGLAAVLEALTGTFGTSLASLPPFAVALAEGTSLRVAVRGSLELEVDTAGGRETISGAGVTTWTERVLDDVAHVTLRTSATAQRDDDPGLPIADGVVLASTVEWVPDAASAAPAEPAATPTQATPAPAPAAPSPAATVAEPVAAPIPENGDAAAAEGSHGPVIASVPLDGSMVETLLPSESTIAPASAAAAATVDPGIGDDDLWGETIARPKADSSSHESEATVQADSTRAVEGDHDGETISVAQARALRTAGIVDSVPPPLAAPRPPAPGRIRLSTGQTLLLDRTVVIGRRPRATRVTGTDLPHLVAVDSPQQDISRSHIELRVEGDSIVATDLRTTNGTTLVRQGGDPVRLHPGEPTVVVPGDVIDLGDGVTVTVEGIS
ncbi:FHA domain-containing protein [Microbacterium sp.]|uniref:FHA domain-containing protein n=1 Tax=Microbacterium sp. TaxID=51671 RepID=UPI002D76DE47|nr:FHA domain-containing protein [Microbacterium sp.]HET6301755.1 FHA domain-containing protein [Microbacterium sp.]